MKRLLSCEHASATVPADFAAAAIPAAWLDSHRGWDPGAATVAKALARRWSCPVHLGAFTRLLIDLNRSAGHRAVLSPYSRRLPAERVAALRDRHYDYQQAVRRDVSDSTPVLHLSIHSFTPALDPAHRNFDLGLLYDPGRPRERELARVLQQRLRACGWQVRRNAPYRGTADGLTRILRRDFSDEHYAGLEIEINQALVTTQALRRLTTDLAAAVDTL